MNDLKWMHWKEWIAKSAPTPLSVLLCLVKSSSRYSLVHICRPHLEKVVWTQKMSYDVYVQSSSRYILDHSRAHFVDHFPGSSNRDPPGATADNHFTRKKAQGFAPASVFRWKFTHSWSLTLPNYLLMMWLTWWCGWHDDWNDDVVAMMVRQLAIDNRP